MDFGGFFLFGLLAFVLLIYVPYALYSVLKRKRSFKLHLSAAAALFALLLLLGGWLFYIYGLNEPLASAAAEGDLSRVRFLLSVGASPNAVGIDNVYTALTGAAEGGHTEIVKLLLQKGAEPFRPDGEGETALDRAKERGHTDIVNLLNQLHQTPAKK